MQLRSLKIEAPTSSQYVTKRTTKRICVFDTETDPFGPELRNIGIKPFSCGFYDGDTYVDFWGDDCVVQFGAYMANRHEQEPDEELLIYVHNLGGFDIHFLYDFMDSDMQPLMVGARIIKAFIFGHEFRDSYKILPVALSAIQKDVFDYQKMLRDRREEHRDEILLYQRHDCEYLYGAIVEFHEMFGDRLTIGATAIAMFESYHGFQRLSEVQDAAIRPYFFGGRTQCFETGVLEDEWKVYDVNSMYPHVMATYKHPISSAFHRRKYISEKTAFVEVEGWNNGGLPIRGAMGELDFTQNYGIYKVSIHEYNAAIETQSFRLKRLIQAIEFELWADFSEYVHYFYKLRLEAKAKGDKLRDLFYKLLLNNAYGKFAQDPSRYDDYTYISGKEPPPEGPYIPEHNPSGWLPRYENDYGIIWARKQRRRPTFFNVATGASITGAARGELLRGISIADRPIYCDTDSIICRGLPADRDATRLGAWKLEAEGNRAAIAGKKMYALFDGDNVVKKAAKGVGLTAEEIERVALGEEIVYNADRPSFSLDGTVEYLQRTITRTG